MQLFNCSLISIEQSTTLELFWLVCWKCSMNIILTGLLRDIMRNLTCLYLFTYVISKNLNFSLYCSGSQYGLAEDTLRTGGSGNPKDVTPNELYSQSAIYIAAAHALKPNYSVSTIWLPFIQYSFLISKPDRFYWYRLRVPFFALKSELSSFTPW